LFWRSVSSLIVGCRLLSRRLLRRIWNDRVLAEICFSGGARGAPPFDATAQMNKENMVQVVVTRDCLNRSMSAYDLPLGWDSTLFTGINLPLRVQAEVAKDAQT
jgi:hypothetical protein